MPFENNFSKKTTNLNELSEKTKLNDDNKFKDKKVDQEFLVSSILSFQRMRESKNPENKAFVAAVEKRVQELVGSARVNVFNKIMDLKEQGVDDWQEVFKEKYTKEAYKKKGYNDQTPLISLDEESLASLLRPLNKELRENNYVTRDKRTFGEIFRNVGTRLEEDVWAFHVSPFELKDSIKPPEGEKFIYFSTDLKRLFDLKEAKYIYAFRVHKDTLKNSQYCAADFFHRLMNVNPQDFLIEDVIKIFNEKNPSYRQEVLKKLGADFYKDYLSNSSRGAEAMKNFNDDRFTL